MSLFAHERVKERVDLLSIKNQARTLSDCPQARAPDLVECPSFDAAVLDGLRVGEAARGHG